MVLCFLYINIFLLNTSQEKNADLQKQLNMAFYPGKHKSQKLNDRKDPDSTSVTVSQESPGIESLCLPLALGKALFLVFVSKLNAHISGKQTAYAPNSRKGNSRTMPAYRRLITLQIV